MNGFQGGLAGALANTAWGQPTLTGLVEINRTQEIDQAALAQVQILPDGSTVDSLEEYIRMLDTVSATYRPFR
ncbi:MAG TPA: hypothetical protein VHR45_09710 [Thermoanaerobaculia bacterium]|nr:hypothetical protein [Thermoanaerobaculia bacterium]